MPDALPPGYRSVGENRVRELVGLGLADFVVGRVVEHRPARTVTLAEHVQILALTGNEAPIHSDVEFCKRTGRDQVLVCGLLTLNIVLGMTVRSTSGLTTANLAPDEVRFEHPVHVGDTLRAQSETLTARRSRSRPEHRVVTCRIEGHNQDDRRVLGTRPRSTGPSR
ncbi:molybdenum cofactor biosynthesis protein MoeC [Embleya scabrispora]|uniref:Molybdenum cofactor biosynthesis protein MoeC n=1 Tax=Embleya scabrispora TaxID=159449 RepID=A0A1T3P903_9ACTN|nr:molybdenum cofactor biosynthesis protein MoeC [Embleya scabrispora]